MGEGRMMSNATGVQGQAFYSSIRLSKLLWRISKKMDITNPVRPPEQPKRDGRHYAVRLSDAVVMDAIRLIRAGGRYCVVSESIGCASETLRQWCEGTNRAHLLRQIESEERAEGISESAKKIAPSKWPWRTMQIGDEFFMRGARIKSASPQAVAAAKRTGHKFKCRSMNGGVKIWRIA